MLRLTLLLAVLFAAACDRPGAEAPHTLSKPMRIVSLDYCADQYVLKLADRDQILAVSPDAMRDYSYMRREAAGLPVVRPSAEDVLLLQPDLVVRSYGGGPNAAEFFSRAGTPVLQIGWTSSILGESENSIESVILQVADGLGQIDRGRAVVDDMRSRLGRIDPAGNERSVLYLTAGGVISGPGSLIHEMIETAGLSNFEQQAGWRDIPLERLTREHPDIVATSFFDSPDSLGQIWSASRHPVTQKQLAKSPVVELETAWVSCGGWFTVDAIEALAAGGRYD